MQLPAQNPLPIPRPEYQQRVMEECEQLADRLSKLCVFIASEKFAHVGKAEQRRMVNQSVLMAKLHSVLCDRIIAFEVTSLSKVEAAGPVLLAALKQMLKDADRVDYAGGTMYTTTLIDARAAVALAEGGAA